ncbi:hexitol phosphatase HxpB [Planctomycetes bacterium K23_9]|uniref:2-deoxyglucose-6-phosphate phosphatase n=1 Tax=Stieleria marina TaxID=1930275 RepID=A0A517NVH5_9BACT|nr:2-deoxyglucose-6-phosphate phosphatase [Planctomycetes bacterium K23_9]
MNIQAAVFDMDGLMIDSQPYWQDAQLEVMQNLGVPITRQDTIETTGMRVDEIVQSYFAKTPWESISTDQVCQRIVHRVVDLVQEHKPIMPGLHHAIETCQQLGLQLGLASSSPMSLIRATIDSFDLHGIFEVQVSGAELKRSKPHPEVYLNACDALGVPPARCVALEDSFVGLLAAKSAEMKAIIVPEASAFAEPRFVISDKKLSSLGELTVDLLESL